MIGSTRTLRVFACNEPVDMRKGHDGLCGLVMQRLGRNVMDGDMFLFVGRCRTRAKVLFWDGTGLVVYAKRLEKGRFTAPWARGTKGPLPMTLSELTLFLEGSHLAGRVRLSPAQFELRSNFADAQHVA